MKTIDLMTGMAERRWRCTIGGLSFGIRVSFWLRGLATMETRLGLVGVESL